MAKEKQYRYSEIFSSMQGEGVFCGVPTIWLRMWGCNLSCPGFGQENLDDPSTWEKPWETTDFIQYKSLDELPIFPVSCDSGYSWSKKVRHLAYTDTATVIADKLIDLMKNPHNEEGSFQHPKSHQETHMAFTGGEPMMSQRGIVDIMSAFEANGNLPRAITIETNGTRDIKDDLYDYIRDRYLMPKSFNGLSDDERGQNLWFWSVSPKLRSSGEAWDDCIKPEVLVRYAEASNVGQLKFVVDGSQETWHQVEDAVKEYRDVGIEWEVWIMPVGARKEDQETDLTAQIAEEAIARGYNVAARVHCYIWSNVIGK